MAIKYDSEHGSVGYAENIVSVKADWKMKLARVIIFSICVILLLAVLMLTSKIPQVFAVWSVIIIALGCISYNYTRREFEYTIASGVLMLDCIYGKKIRKKVLEIPLSSAVEISKVAFPCNEILSKVDANNVLYACNKNDNYIHYMLYNTKGDKQALLFFSAPDNVINSLKFYNRAAIK